MEADGKQFAGKTIKEIDCFNTMCEIFFDDGTVLQVSAEIGNFGTTTTMIYDIEKGEENK